MAITDIYPTAIREYEYSPGNGTAHSPLNIAGDVWAIACSGPDRDAWLYTVTIVSSGNTIGTIQAIGSLELEDGITCYSTKLKRITGNNYLVAYIDDAGNTVRCVTVEISPDGTIVGIIDGPRTLVAGVAQHLDIERRSSGVYLLAYSSTGFTNLLATFNISDAGAITTIPLGTAIMAAAASEGYDIYHLPTVGNFLIAYQSAGIRLSTYTVDAAGNIGAEIDFLVLAVGGIVHPEMVNVAGINYVLITQGAGSDGWLYTFECTDAGLLGAAAIDSFEFDAVYANHPTICNIAGINFAFAWRDNDWDGQVATIDIAATGNIGAALLDQEEYESGQAREPRIVLISAAVTGLLAIFSSDAANDGWIHTIGIGSWVASVLTTQAVSNILSTTATGNANVTVLGVPAPSQHGHCWNTTGTPTISDDKTELGALAATGAFTSPMTVLTPGTLYYVRAYVTNMLGTVYGAEVTFATPPAVTTDPATSVVNNSAQLNGTLDSAAGETCPSGFEWGETGAYGNTTPTQNRTTGQTFTQTIYPLKANTTYYFRAFATNSGGTGYGAQRTLTTSQVPHYASTILPEVDTRPATLVTQHTARLNGIVIEDNGVIGATRFQWGLTTGYGNNTSWEQGYNKGDEFFVNLNKLAEGQAFHFRAQYRNQGGIYDGRDMTINTPSPLGPVTLVTDEIMQLLEAV